VSRTHQINPVFRSAVEELEGTQRIEPTATPSPRASATHRQARVPSYRLHKPSGNAVVTIAGKDHYLGTHGSVKSRQEYDRSIAEWLAKGRPTFEPKAGPNLTIAAFVLAHWRHVKATYARQTGRGTIAPALRHLRKQFGHTPAWEFGPKKLRTLQLLMVDVRTKKGRRFSRRYVNRLIGEIKRAFKWAVAEELVPAGILHGLQALEPLRMGRTDAPETKPVAPIEDAVVETTLIHLPPMLADMVRVQRLTGMRPGELCMMRVSELDMSGDVWLCCPLRHKTAHHGKTRSVVIGPKAQGILRKYLRTELAAYLFNPADSVRQRLALAHADRKTPVQPSQQQRAARAAARPKRRFRDYYTTQAYELAIRRACIDAGVKHWSPNQLRHTRATELRRQFGLDTASAVLGHAKIETTQIYAEKNLELAAQAARATG